MMVDALDTRATVPVGRVPVRRQVILQIMQRLRDALFEKDDTAPDARKLFDNVKFGNLDEIRPEETPCAAFEETQETVIPGMGYVQKQMRIFINFKPIYAHGVDASELLDYYLARIEEELVTDPHLGDTALAIDPAGNSIQANGATDPEPGAIIYFDVDYRYYEGQPFTQI